MMKQRFFSSCLILLIVFAFLPFIQGGCGGGGGGGGSSGTTFTENTSPQANATLTQNNSAEPAEVLSALPLIGEVVNAGDSTSSSTAGSLSTDRRQDLLGNLQTLIHRVANKMEQGSVSALSSYSEENSPCASGGKESISMQWIGPPMGSVTECSQMSDVTMEITSNNCTEMGVTIDGTMSVSFPGRSCDLLAGTPSSMSITMNGTIDDPAETLTAEFDHFTIDISNLVVNAGSSEVDIPQMDALLNGSISGTIDGENASIAFNNFSLHIDKKYDAHYGYYCSTTLDGLVRTTCMDGWVKITTIKPIAMPETFSTCPFGGEFSVQGSNTTVTITALNPGVNITFKDETKHYATCDDVPDTCLQ
ncbi:MAG: hypothetical protein GXP58_08790 [Deltaproteobacteria bacterium]|nr:hypothetical protein [Deltaproteobacteria bacterium]